MYIVEKKFLDESLDLFYKEFSTITPKRWKNIIAKALRVYILPCIDILIQEMGKKEFYNYIRTPEYSFGRCKTIPTDDNPKDTYYTYLSITRNPKDEDLYHVYILDGYLITIISSDKNLEICIYKDKSDHALYKDFPCVLYEEPKWIKEQCKDLQMDIDSICKDDKIEIKNIKFYSKLLNELYSRLFYIACYEEYPLILPITSPFDKSNGRYHHLLAIREDYYLTSVRDGNDIIYIVKKMDSF